MHSYGLTQIVHISITLKGKLTNSSYCLLYRQTLIAAAQWILPSQIDRTQRTVDHSHFDGVSFAAC